MTALLIHAQAARSLGKALRERAGMAQGPGAREVLDLMGCAHIDAAQAMEEAARMEAVAHGKAFACTVDHRAMTARNCPACGAAKAK